MEQLREEQGRLLLRQMSEVLPRQNVRTAGRTFHKRLPATSPVISQPTQPMDVDAETALGSLNSNRVGVETPNQPTQSPPSTRLQQASQMNAELEQRRNTTMKRKEETAMNHRGEVFKQAKPTLAEQMLNIQPPRAIPEIIPIFY
jgi:hypothetical protein